MSGKVIVLRPGLVTRNVPPVTEEVAEQQRVIRELAAHRRELRKNRDASRA